MHRQPLDRLERHARAGPGRRIPGETSPALAKLVSMAGAACRSTTVTSWPAPAARRQRKRRSHRHRGRAISREQSARARGCHGGCGIIRRMAAILHAVRIGRADHDSLDGPPSSSRAARRRCRSRERGARVDVRPACRERPIREAELTWPSLPPSSPRRASTTLPPRSPASPESTTAASITCEARCSPSSQVQAPAGRVRACYPFVRVHTDTVKHVDSRLFYGFVAGPGMFETTLTRPDLFGELLSRAIAAAAEKPSRHSSKWACQRAAHSSSFRVCRTIHLEGDLDRDRLLRMRDVFDMPDLARSTTASSTARTTAAGRAASARAVHGGARRFFAASAEALHGTAPKHFQNYVLYTNYQFYIDEFVKLGRTLMCIRRRGAARLSQRIHRRSSNPATWSRATQHLGEPDEEPARRRRVCRKCPPIT